MSRQSIEIYNCLLLSSSSMSIRSIACIALADYNSNIPWSLSVLCCSTLRWHHWLPTGQAWSILLTLTSSAVVECKRCGSSQQCSHDPGRRAGLGGDLQGVRQVSWGGAQRLAVETQPSPLSEPGEVREGVVLRSNTESAGHHQDIRPHQLCQPHSSVSLQQQTQIYRGEASCTVKSTLL